MKNLKQQGILLYSSILILFVTTIISNINKGTNPIIIVVSVIAAFMSSIYSIISHVENYLIRKNRAKGRLSSITFTDREEDVEHILQKLLTTEHIIEICGNGKQCGKSWIAMKIVDYINHPEEYPDKKIKFPYKAAYYIDFNQDSIEKIESFFDNNIINFKTVIIFDHVNDIDYILLKQSVYHFQLIYILQDNFDYNFFKYSVSIFQESKINELQSNIRKNYFGIDNLTEPEIRTLYTLTAGNIGKIHSLLSSQKCVKWIKDITLGIRTDYDEELCKIKMELLIGEYQSAQRKLQQFETINNLHFPNNNAMYYNYILIKADCEHLLNHYENALQLLSIIEADPYRSNNKNYELELYKAHYYKHLWKCNEALEMLHNIYSLTYSAKVDALGILVAKYFINDLFVPYSNSTSLMEFLDVYNNAYNNINIATAQDALKCKRCTAIYLYYTDSQPSLEELVLKITEVIDKYKSEHDRLLANAYFIRGEIYRLYGQYDRAMADYKRTTSITLDNNIIVQTNLMVFYLVHCKKIKAEFNALSENEIINLCAKNNYAQIVWRRINSVCLNDPTKQAIINCFDSRIMPIL